MKRKGGGIFTMRIVLAVLLSLCIMFPAISFGEELTDDELSAQQTQKISDWSEPAQTVVIVNGRPQHLDTDDRTAEELNAVERTIIRRDTIITNRQNLQNRQGE